VRLALQPSITICQDKGMGGQPREAEEESSIGLPSGEKRHNKSASGKCETRSGIPARGRGEQIGVQERNFRDDAK